MSSHVVVALGRMDMRYFSVPLTYRIVLQLGVVVLCKWL